MRNIFHIIGKDLKLLLRSRSSALIIILAPLLVILLVGVAFDNANAFGLTIGVYTPTESTDVDAFVDKLAEREFHVIKYTSEESCVNDIKLGSTHTCVIFPAKFVFEGNDKKEITFYVDYSKINLVWMVMDTLSSKFGAQAREISKNLASTLITKLENSKTELEAKKPVVAQLATSSGEMKAKVSTVSTALASLDLTYNPEGLPIGAIKNELAQIRDTLSVNLETAKAKITAAKAGAAPGPAADLEKAIESIDGAQSSLSATEGASLTHLGIMITALQNQLIAVQNRLAQADSVRGVSVASVSEVDRALGASVQQLEAIRATVDGIIADVNSVRVTDPSAVAEPIVTNIKPVNAQQTYLNYLFPSLMILVVMFIALLLGTTLVMMEKHSPAYFRNFITPTRGITFIIATYLTNMVLIVVQLVIILAIAGYFFSAQVLPSLPAVIGVLLLAATFFTLAGMVIGYLFMSEETATLASISLGSVFLFMSSVIIPIESMPTAVRAIAAFNPFVLSERVLRQVLLFSPSFQSVMNDVGLMLGYSILLFLFLWGSQKFVSKHFVQKIMHRHHKKRQAELQRREQRHIAERAKVIVRVPLTQRILHPLRRKAPAVGSEARIGALQAEIERISSELKKVK